MSTPPADMGLILARLDAIDRRLDGQVSSPWYTSAQAARFLRCSTRKIEELTQLGLLPYSRLDPTASKSSRRYHQKYLTAYLLTGWNPINTGFR